MREKLNRRDFGRTCSNPGVSTPESNRRRFLNALEVKRNAARGFAFGIVATAAVYAFFIVLPGGFELGRDLYYLGLAAVMAVGLGGLTTAVLVALRARRLVREQ
jgi:hypothetical protein